MIRTFHVTRRYDEGTLALADVTVEVRRGEFVYLTGPSGAGKTSFFRVVSGLERPDEGQVIVAGRNLARLRVRELPFFRRDIGIVFQDFKLLPGRSVFDNVALALVVRGVARREIRPRVEGLLAETGLAHKAEARAVTLSGGEQQRVAIARSLVGEPRLLLADEPTGNVDPDMGADIMELFARAHRRGTTVLIATHDLAWVERSGHRRIELAAGRIVADPGPAPGDPEEPAP